MNPETRRHLANLALYCYAAFIATVLAMPMLKDAYSPVDQPISEGAISDHGGVQTLGFFALAAGSFVTAMLLRSVAASGAVLVTSALLAISAVGVVGLAVFPTDAPGQDTTIGAVHGLAAGIAFVANIAAMLWSGRAFREERVLSQLAPMSLVVGAIALVLLSMVAAGVGPVGVAQRATVACELVWLMLVTLTMRSVTADVMSEPGAVQG